MDPTPNRKTEVELPKEPTSPGGAVTRSPLTNVGGAPSLEPELERVFRAPIGIVFEDMAAPAPRELAYAGALGPVFGAFRPILGRPDSLEGEQALLEVMRAFEYERLEPSAEVIVGAARIIAVATFPLDEEGAQLTEKLIGAILRRNPDLFGGEDRTLYAAATGRREFPNKPHLASLMTGWVQGSLSSEEDEQLGAALTRKGVQLLEIVPGRVWVRNVGTAGVGDSGDEEALTRLLEGRGLSGSDLPPLS